MARYIRSIITGLASLIAIQFVVIFTYTKYAHTNCVLSSQDLGYFPNKQNDIKARKVSVNDIVAKTEYSSFKNWTYSLTEDHPRESSIPCIVHQVLTKNTVTFRNYLSILSVYKILRPYRIILYVHNNFKPKQYEYNRWFQTAVSEIPCLEIVHSHEVDRLRKMFDTPNEIRFVSSVLKEGGVYVNLNTVINFDLCASAHDSIQIGFAANSLLGFIAVDKYFNFTDLLLLNPSMVDVTNYTSRCVFTDSFSAIEPCCNIQEEIFPVDIMHRPSPFGDFARQLFYGTPNSLEPQKRFAPIPKIVHYMWFGNQSISYSMYLSFWSTIRFVQPLKVIIYVDSFKLGYYFDEMKKFSCVSIIFYGSPKSVFQRPIKKPSHISDYVRTDVLLRFGGIYMDWDVFWLKPVDDLLSLGYETIAAYDHFKDYDRREFPDTINMGVVLARPGSRFISLWQDTFHEYTGERVTFHAVEMVYKVYEQHPDLLYIEKHLQVMCFLFKCHPLWLANYQNDRVHNNFDFTREAYSVHFTDPVPKPFTSENDMKSSNGFFADMARHVYGNLNRTIFKK